MKSCIDVTRRRRRVRRDTQTEIPKPRGKSNRCSIFTFNHISRERWNQSVGEWSPEKWRAALEEQKRRKGGNSGAEPMVAAVHGDNKGAGRRLYKGFNWGLGAYVESRSEEKRLMKQAGLQHAR